MNPCATDTSGSRTELGDDVFQLPWSGWEEDILEIRLPSSTVEDELEAHLRTEINGGGGGQDVANTFEFDIGDPFPGVSIDVQSLFGSCGEIELLDWFDNIDAVQPETSSPPLYSEDEKNEKPISLIEPSIQLLTDYGSDIILDTAIEGLWSPDGEEEVCTASVDDSEWCETSTDEPNSCEASSASVSVSTRCKRTYAESSAEEDEGADDDDWTATRKRKRNCKKVGTNKPRRNLRKTDSRTRKKEQNRNAATRYREKKKLVDQEMQGAIELLEVRNKELRKEIQDKEHEVHVMRQLLVDILRPKKSVP